MVNKRVHTKILKKHDKQCTICKLTVKITDKTADRYLWVIGISSYTGGQGWEFSGNSESGYEIFITRAESKQLILKIHGLLLLLHASVGLCRDAGHWLTFCFQTTLLRYAAQGVVGRVRGGTASPTFFDRGTRPALPHFFGLKFVQKLVHCCNWLLTETQCKIISVRTAELMSICYRHSNTSRCIAGQDQRSAVIIFLTCTSVRVCRPKLFKNLCLSLVSGVPPTSF